MENKRFNRTLFNGKGEFQTYFLSHYPSLRSFAFKLVGTYPIAEDLVQESFIKLWEKKNDFESEHAAKSFLYTTVKNLSLNHLEHIKVVQKHQEFVRNEVIQHDEINGYIIQEETYRLIYNAINELPPQCRKIVMFSINGLKNHEIADELNLSENTVKTQKKIAYKQLKIKLKDIYPLVGLLLGRLI